MDVDRRSSQGLYCVVKSVVMHAGQLCSKGRGLQWLLHLTSSYNATRISATRVQDSKVS